MLGRLIFGDDNTQPIDGVPLLNSKEPVPWVRQLHDKNDIIGEVNEGVRTRRQIANLISYMTRPNRVSNYTIICSKLPRLYY